MRTLLLIGGVALALAVEPKAIGVGSAPVSELERALADWRLGCGGCPMRFGWDSYQLALFVGGRLVSLGFPSDLARSGSEWWVMVRLQQEKGEIVVPVLPGLPPLDRDDQFTVGVFLGRIPWLGPGQVSPAYSTPEERIHLAEQSPPAVRVLAHPAEPQVGEQVWLTADVSGAEGAVVQVFWEFGDGGTSTGWSPEHAYPEEGTYTVDPVGCE